MKLAVLFLFCFSFLFYSCSSDSPTKNEPKTYETLQIGSNVWMLKNLDVDHYKNGDIIPQVQIASEWASLTTGAWCYYEGDSKNNAKYGKLYNWYAVNDPRGLAPEGFRVATDQDWKSLELSSGFGTDELDKTNWRGAVCGGKMKATGSFESTTGLWHSPNKGATNSTGFSALPGGFRHNLGNYFSIGYYGDWWTTTTANPSAAWYRQINHDLDEVFRGTFIKNYGLSVRCVKN